MPESVPALFNTIRRVVDEFGGPPELASALCTEIGEEFLAAVYDQARESFQLDEQPHGRLGMTEVEASLRWCPHVREHTPVGKGTKDVAIGNRYLDSNGQDDYTNPAGCRCIGSMCLAWRWTDPQRGYCGLAGRPTYQPINEPRRVPHRSPLGRPTASEQVDLYDVDQKGGT
jgi:hypothetical protein